MGCFSTCFPNSRRRKSLRPRKNTTPCLDQLLQIDESIEALQLTDINEPVHALPDTEDVKRGKSNISGRKKVTFDLNLKIYESLPDQEEPEEGDFMVKSSTDNEEENKNTCHSDSSSSSSLFSFPPDNYRYQNYCDSDDEFDQLVSDDESDLDPYTDDEDDEGEEESAESLFSLSIDSRKHKLSTEKGDKEVNSPMPMKTTSDEDDKMRNFDSVLNPVENLTQWKAIKARAKLTSQNKAKENKISITEEPIPKPPVTFQRANTAKPTRLNHEIAVDTSLSTWLVDTSSASVGNSPQSERTGSPMDFEDRPILGALTVEDIKEVSVASTPRKSPSRSPDDMPIIGSVGAAK